MSIELKNCGGIEDKVILLDMMKYRIDERYDAMMVTIDSINLQITRILVKAVG